MIMTAMKKLISLIIPLLFGIAVYAQPLEFVLQPDLSSLTADGSDYCVITEEGSSQAVLFEKYLSAVKSSQKNLEDAFSTIPGESITVERYWPESLNFEQGVLACHWGAYVRMQFQFKDGRVRVSAPRLSAIQMGAKKSEGVASFSENFKVFQKGKPGKSKKSVYLYDTITKLLNDSVNDIVSPKEDNW